ncbi:MAG TPA: glutathione S-transferase family protein [Candidatus Polarisedimenticolia bacterium]|jgi:glutathione S-transferase
MLTLYQFEGSPYCWKVRIALAEKKLEYKGVVPVNRDTDPKFKALTPIGKVPVLVLEDGTALYESTIINEFLEERYPSPPLLPNDPADRGRARIFEEIGDAYLGPALRLITTARYRFDAGKHYRLRTVNKEQEAEGIRVAGRYLDHLDGALEGQEYFVTQFSLADVGLVPYLVRTARLLDLPISVKWPSIGAWCERMTARPSVSSTQPPPYQILDDPR